MEFVLGVDGGGSKVICLAADSQGRLVGVGSGGPVNTNYVSRWEAVSSLTSAISIALKQAGLQPKQIARLCISAPCDPGAVHEAQEACGIGHIIRAAEGETPRWAARFWIYKHIGVTIDAGTGSLARGWTKDGRLASAGGWGTTLGDEGSGFWIGIQAMRAVLQAHDGRIEPTCLEQSVLNHYRMSDVLDLVFQATQGLVESENHNQYVVAPDSGIGSDEVENTVGGYCFRSVNHRHTLSRAEIASLSPVVTQAARQGDWKAKGILEGAGKELGNLCVAVIKRLEMEEDEFIVVPFGGVFRAGELVLRSFQETTLAVAERARVITPRFEPVVGAVLLAIHAIGIDITPGILFELNNTSTNFPACRNLRVGG